MQSYDVFPPSEQPSDISRACLADTEYPKRLDTAGENANRFDQWGPGITQRQSNAGLYSPNQRPSWDRGAQSSTLDDGLYHPGRKTLGGEETKKSAAENGLPSSGYQGTNGWSQDGGVWQPGGGVGGTGGQWSQGTTPGNTVANAGQASIEGTSPQSSTTTSSLQATQAASKTRPTQTATPSASLGYKGQGTSGNGKGGQSAPGSGGLSQAGVAAPDDGLYHPEHSSTNGQGAQQWTPGGELDHPGAWGSGSTTKPISTYSRPESTATHLSPPLSSSSITSSPTATNNPSDSTTTNTHDATKLAVPVSLGAVTAVMAGFILWWLYRRYQATKAARKRNNTLEEGDYTKGTGPSFFKRSFATLCGYSLFKFARKPPRVIAPSFLRIRKRSGNQCEDHLDANDTPSLDETSIHDIEKLQPPEYATSTEMVAPDYHRGGDISMPYTTQKAETCIRPRTATPTSLPGVPEEPEGSEESSHPITPLDSQGAVYSVELSFKPVRVKQIELKQGQTAILSKEYGDGWVR
ncbi:hypothetical protein BDV27DRAFT_166139 [Aspergillus caelatus]|uniref:Uncharacterized protein n=1 Tax=Aspergillus caelatus TaxID=61420 RepID=A0A5N7AH55_9EURO|nr:uncharacterized protein BDV27DRAFT_166139 [Aspergillus caelatus]KAE8369201.1 hypothetical protein BDV27DRAFT_166139 [Aspergillus caelatus]